MKSIAKDVGDQSWDSIAERLKYQRDEARLETAEDILRHARSVNTLQNSAGLPSGDFKGAIE